MLCLISGRNFYDARHLGIYFGASLTVIALKNPMITQLSYILSNSFTEC